MVRPNESLCNCRLRFVICFTTGSSESSDFRIWHKPTVGTWAEHVRPAPVDQTSTCSAMAKASSTSMPRYLTVPSILVWPSNGCPARRLALRRQIRVAFVRLSEWAPKTNLHLYWEGWP